MTIEIGQFIYNKEQHSAYWVIQLHCNLFQTLVTLPGV
jgi:hypothetical protein